MVTKLKAGHAENALPVSATATLNCRILPQTDPERIVSKIRNSSADQHDDITLMIIECK